jgi:YVTN family beta-propeller protein
VEDVAAVVSVIDVAAGKVTKELRLPSGSGALKDIRVSPDGKHAIVSHILAQFKQSTAHIYRGWMNRNAVTIIDLARMEIYNTMLLDQPSNGAANPWGLAWLADSTHFLATLAGTHELCIVDFAKVLAQLPGLRSISAASGPTNLAGGSRLRAASLNELPLQIGGREQVKLPTADLGPRAVAVVGQQVYVANYFSDTLSVIDLAAPHKAESIPLGPKQEMSTVRKGGFYFHDATICLQGWQSCSSCHPNDARADGLNWDLLNDGIGNPKNTKSLLLAHQTPPAMSLGVRETAEAAVRAGIKHILFTDQPKEISAAIDEYLKSLKPVPGPYLVHGKLSDAAKRGEKIFAKTGCADCHVPGLYTDLHPHDVGTRAVYDRPVDKFYTPTLIEVWRTAPYLHDGSAATMRDVVTTCNPHNQHGETSSLSSQEIDDLCEYVLSL